MPKGKRRKEYNVSDPSADVSAILREPSPKYRVGAKGVPFYDIRSFTPTFAFDYISLSESKLCFNCPSKSKEDLLGFIEGLQKVSKLSYQDLRTNPIMRFHPVDLESADVSLNPDDFFRILAPSGRGMTIEELPALYQFDLQYKQAARAFGFLYKAVFYVIWYDHEHLVYPGKKK